MTLEEYSKMHQKAFRTAFNFLNAHFPPGTDDAWWDRSAKELSAASVEAGEDRLVLELLNAVFTYIGYEYHRRMNDNEKTDSREV